MTKNVQSICVAIVGVMLALPAMAQVRDADYRGTLVCGKLTFAQDPTRAAITVKIAGNQGPYERPVHMPIRTRVAGMETGTGQGRWGQDHTHRRLEGREGVL